jgi:hypothetical protein
VAPLGARVLLAPGDSSKVGVWGEGGQQRGAPGGSIAASGAAAVFAAYNSTAGALGCVTHTHMGRGGRGAQVAQDGRGRAGAVW